MCCWRKGAELKFARVGMSIHVVEISSFSAFRTALCVVYRTCAELSMDRMGPACVAQHMLSSCFSQVDNFVKSFVSLLLIVA